MKKFLFTVIIFITLLLTKTNSSLAFDRIHIITVSNWSDAIILESNGHYAMIDTGEDYSYPDGKDKRYPVRDGIATDSKLSTEDRLKFHISELGIKKFDFILITHAHSDHIGSAPDILNMIPTDRLYLKLYSDERISDKTRLWDNLYCYDKTIEAAQKTNTKLIQNITEQDSIFSLGNMKINLFNYKNEYDSSGKLTQVYDDNLNSIVSVIEVNNKRIFLGGDLENTDLHKEDYLAPLIGKVDIAKFNHHVETTKSNTKNFIETLSPTKIIKTSIQPVENNYKKFLDNRHIEIINAGRLDTSAIVLDISPKEISDITSEYRVYGFYTENSILKFKDWNGNFPKEDWYLHNDNWYYFKPNGIVSTSWNKINNVWYYFDSKGVM